MTTTRVYLPATAARLQAAVVSGRLPAGPAHAVTPALREWYVDGDLEELELAALTDAAQQCLALLAAERDAAATPPASPAPSPPARRVVVAVDAPEALVRPASAASTAVGERPTGRSVVRLVDDLPITALVSVHVDEDEAVPDVAGAVLALGGAARGEPEALEAVEDAEARDLLWYDTTEVGVLAAELSGP